MLITKTSIFSGEKHTIEMDVTKEELADWKSGTLIQHAMPRLSASEREFLITGITEEEWEELKDDLY
jgi:hypothetical protein